MVTAALMAAGFCSSPAAAQTVSSGDATLSALSVSPRDIIGFDGGRTSYEVGVDSSVMQATVSATANDAAAMVAFAPQDADANVEGHHVNLSAGRNVVTVTVTAENGSTQDYTVSVNRGVTAGTGWQAGADLDGLIAAGNSRPHGIWSDGTTVWVADWNDNKLYAYRLSDGMRDADRDMTLAASNPSPYGIWSDETTVWVADRTKDKLYAYNLSDGMREDARDITLDTDNDDAYGIWSDGATIWVADQRDSKVYAYNLSDGMRDDTRDINTLLAARNGHPSGIWSDGTTIWVAEVNDGKIYAYNLSDGMRDDTRDINTLAAADNTAPHAIWSDGTTMWVTDWSDHKLYAYLMPMPLTGDASLSALSVSPKDIIGFKGGRRSYEVGVGSSVTQATVSATANDAAAMEDFDPLDAAANVEGHQVDLSAGRNVVTVTVTAGGGFTQDYKVSVNRGVTDAAGWQAGADLDSLIAAGISRPYGVWSDGTTIWVADRVDQRLYAYRLSDGTRDAPRDVTLKDLNEDAWGIWSDGTIIWVADFADQRLYAYNLSDGTREYGRDINTPNTDGLRGLQGIWSDGTTMWVAVEAEDKLYAYRLSDGARDSGRDITLTHGNGVPSGIWSDGTTMWVADTVFREVFAYRLSDGARDVDRDYDLYALGAAGNRNPRDIWSNGRTMWVADGTDSKLYAYNMPDGVRFGQSTYSVDEGGAVEVPVILRASLDRTVVIPISTDKRVGATDSDFTVDSIALTFNPGETEKIVTFSAVEDTVDDDGESVTLSFGTLPDGIATGIIAETTVSIIDDDSAGVTVSESSLTIDEGGSDTYTVVLDTQPSADVTVTISGHAGTDVSLSDTELTFTDQDWDTAQMVTVTAGGEDDDTAAEAEVTLSHAVTGASEYAAIDADDVPSVLVTITEDDSAGVTVSESSLTIGEGGSDTYTVVLDTQPSADVTVTISGHSGTDVSLSDTELTFTDQDWDTAQTVTVTAGEDDDAVSEADVTLSHAVTGASEYEAIDADDVPSVLVTITENDSAGVTISESPLTIGEGASDTYTVVLDSEPAGEVTVTVTVGGHAGTDVRLSGNTLSATNTLTFTTGDWDTAQTVTVTAEHDDDAVEDTATLTHTVSSTGDSAYNNLPEERVEVTINEDDSAGGVHRTHDADHQRGRIGHLHGCAGHGAERRGHCDDRGPLRYGRESVGSDADQ